MAEQRRTLTVPETAAALGVSSDLVYDEIRAGRIRSVRIGRRILVPREELDRLLQAAS